jgi:hypothetical protein
MAVVRRKSSMERVIKGDCDQQFTEYVHHYTFF